MDEDTARYLINESYLRGCKDGEDKKYQLTALQQIRIAALKAAKDVSQDSDQTIRVAKIFENYINGKGE